MEEKGKEKMRCGREVDEKRRKEEERRGRMDVDRKKENGWE